MEIHQSARKRTTRLPWRRSRASGAHPTARQKEIDFDVLVTLVEAYEQKHYPIEPPDPIEAILHQMESQGLNLI